MDLTDNIKRNYQRVSKPEVSGDTSERIIEKLKQRSTRIFTSLETTVSEPQPTPTIDTGIEIPDPSKFNTEMDSAYASSSYMMKRKMQKEDPQKLNLLNRLTESDVIVIPGFNDHINQVFDSANTPYTSPLRYQINDRLSDAKLVFVNCSGELDNIVLNSLVDFVSNGGYLITTDWALTNVIEKIFPGIAKRNGSTEDDVVKISEPSKPTIYSAGMFEKGTNPQWWLETVSYPIQILDNTKANVILTSSEMAKKYEEPTIAFYFDHGKGKVFHFISHFYLQKTNNTNNKNSSDFAIESLDLTDEEISPIKNRLDNLTGSQAESAYSSTVLIHNIIIDRLRKDYG